MPQTLLVLLLMLLQGSQAPTQQVQTPSDQGQQPNDIVLRQPFVLKLKLQDGSNYQEHFDQTPFIKNGNIYIFPGENFGVNIAVEGDKIGSLSYIKDASRADLQLKFTERGNGRGVMMLLVIENKLKQTLYLDAAMQIPKRSGAYKTSILPVFGGKGGFESWPHPISLLVLRNLRFTKELPTP